MADEETRTTWQYILMLIIDEGEGIFNDWITHEYLDDWFEENKGEHWANIRKLIELGVIITNEHGDYLMNFDWDQRPTIDRGPPPRRAPAAPQAP